MFARFEINIAGPVKTLGDVRRLIDDMLDALEKQAPLDYVDMSRMPNVFQNRGISSLTLCESGVNDADVENKLIDVRFSVHDADFDRKRQTADDAIYTRGDGIPLTGDPRPGDNIMP